jgi:hypothetical protein
MLGRLKLNNLTIIYIAVLQDRSCMVGLRRKAVSVSLEHREGRVSKGLSGVLRDAFS